MSRILQVIVAAAFCALIAAGALMLGLWSMTQFPN